MNKIKKVIFILLISFVILILKKNVSFAAVDITSLHENAVKQKVTIGQRVGQYRLEGTNNVYCTQHENTMYNNTYAKVNTYIKISGNKVQFRQENSATLKDATYKTGSNAEEIKNWNPAWGPAPTLYEYNGYTEYYALANILKNMQGYGRYNAYTTTQRKLYGFLNQRKNFIANELGPFFCSNNYSKTKDFSKEWADAQTAEKTGKGFQGTLEIYLLVPITSSGQNKIGVQNLMVVTYSPKVEVVDTALTIKKVDAYTNDVLAGAKFIIGQQGTGSNGQDVYLKNSVNQGNTYDYEWTTNKSEAKIYTTDKYGKINLYDLPEKINGTDTYIVYTIEETEPPDGYKSNSNNRQTMTATFSSGLEVTVTVTNIPDSFDNQLIIYKRDAMTKESLEGVGFVIKRQFLNQSVSSNGESCWSNSEWRYLRTNGNGSYEWVSSKSSADTFYTDASGRIVIKNLEVSETTYVKEYFRGLCRYHSGYRRYIYHRSGHYMPRETKINYQVEEVSMPSKLYGDYWGNIGNQKSFVLTPNSSNDYITQVTVDNMPISKPTGNVKISGKVWVEGASTSKGNGNFNDEYNSGKDELLAGIRVYWKDASGNIISTAVTNGNGRYEMGYTINYDFCTWSMDQQVYNRLNNSYIEFEYDGKKYTTVKNNMRNSENTSRAIENYDSKAKSRYDLDSSFCKVNNNGIYDSDSGGNRVTDFTVTADTSKIKNILSGRYYDIETVRKNGCIYHTYRTVHHKDGSTSTETVHHYDYRITEWNIKNMNLGLFEKEQPDLGLVSDIAKVDVIMKGQKYTYTNGNRGITSDDYGVNTKVSFGNNETYNRPVNPSDIAYVNDNNTQDLEVYITYNIRVQNQSSTLYTQVKEIVNYYDSRLEIVQSDNPKKQWHDTSQYSTYGNQIKSNGFNKAYSTELATDEDGYDLLLEPQTLSDTIEIKFRVKDEVVKSLINQEPILFSNVSEIYAYASYYGSDTWCAEHTTAQDRWRTGQRYSGLDIDSSPGTAEISMQNDKLDTKTYEDDTDLAPTFKLQADENYKIISGTVFEDSQTEESKKTNERLGNGIKDNGENAVENVRVELLRVNDEGTETAKLYTINNKQPASIEAVTYTNENGDYYFEGIVVDNYILKYTYGGSDNEDEKSLIVYPKEENGTTKTEKAAIDARNYKSTIITQDPVKTIMQNNTNDDVKQSDLLWHLITDENVSTAVDDIDDLHWKYRTKQDEEKNVNVNYDEDTEMVNENTNRQLDKESRLQIKSLINNNFETPTRVSAYSLPFKVQVEYTKEQIQEVTEEGDKLKKITNAAGQEEIVNESFDYDWDRFNFGIIERPRENIVVDKTIDRLKITLANGQVLTEGNPYSGNMDYTRALGNKEITTRDKFLKAIQKEKQVFMEMDTELIQGAKLEIIYKITVTNNSEEDVEYDKYDELTQGGDEKYYWYGEVEREGKKIAKDKLIKQSTEYLVDYVDSSLVCETGKDSQNAVWQKVKKDQLRNHISQKVSNSLNANNKQDYTILVTNAFKNVAPNESHSETLYASKLLAAQAKNHVYENHTEIIQLNGKTARTIYQTNKGEQIAKEYKPGDYVPSLNGRVKKLSDDTTQSILERLHEQDDDSTTLFITPPTGLPENIKMYMIVGAIGLIAIGIEICIIKRKIT